MLTNGPTHHHRRCAPRCPNRRDQLSANRPSTMALRHLANADVERHSTDVRVSGQLQSLINQGAFAFSFTAVSRKGIRQTRKQDLLQAWSPVILLIKHCPGPQLIVMIRPRRLSARPVYPILKATALSLCLYWPDRHNDSNWPWATQSCRFSSVMNQQGWTLLGHSRRKERSIFGSV